MSKYGESAWTNDIFKSFLLMKNVNILLIFKVNVDVLIVMLVFYPMYRFKHHNFNSFALLIHLLY